MPTRIRSWSLVAVSGAALVLSGCVGGDGDSEAVAMYPIDDSVAANAQTTISFRGATADELSDLVVTGSESGAHEGELSDHPDGQGASFRPDEPFQPGENVEISTSVDVVRSDGDDEDADDSEVDDDEDGDGDGIGFRVAVPADPPDELPEGAPSELPDPEVLEFATMPDVRAPVATVDGDVGSDVFLTTPRSLGDSTVGAAIIDHDGDLVWWQPSTEADTTIGNLSAHEIDDEPVLAWFEGTAPFGVGKYFGEWIVVDSTYEEVVRIPGANGIPTDIHDLVLTDDGTALVVAYQPVIMDLTDDGGPATAAVLDSVVQEIDLGTGDVYFEWHSLDAVPISDTRIDDLDGATVDYSHINSVDVGPDGNVLISLRHTSQVMEIDRRTGEPVWILGGDSNTVDIGDDIGISYPHHARWLPDGTLSVFDNGVERDSPTSRGVVYEMSEDRSSAEVVAVYAAAPPVFTPTQGSIQVEDGEAFAMWSTLGIGTRFDEAMNPTGTIDLGTGSYRLFSTDWVGTPAQPPVAVADGNRISVSWNGATHVDRWEVLGDDEGLESAAAESFETAIEISADAAASVDTLQVRALDAAGDVIPNSLTSVDQS